MYYSLCAGQTKAGPYGYSPLPLNLVQAGFEQIAKLKAADPAVDLTDRDVESCNNPTFDGKNLSKNKLAEIAPQPAACDKAGEGPCGTDTGTGEPSTDDGATPGVTVETPGTPTGAVDPATGAPAAPGDGAAPVVDPATGEVGHRDRRHATTGGQAADLRRHPPSSPRPPGRHRDVRLGRGDPRWSRWCCCPACWSRRSGAAARRAAPMTAPRLRRSRRPLAVSVVALLLAGLVAAFAPASAAPVASADDRGTANVNGRTARPSRRPRR